MDAPPLIRARPPNAAAFAMLEAAKLPIEDLEKSSLEHFFFAGAGEKEVLQRAFLQVLDWQFRRLEHGKRGGVRRASADQRRSIHWSGRGCPLRAGRNGFARGRRALVAPRAAILGEVANQAIHGVEIGAVDQLSAL